MGMAGGLASGEVWAWVSLPVSAGLGTVEANCAPYLPPLFNKLPLLPPHTIIPVLLQTDV
jgi:hypothetical protein